MLSPAEIDQVSGGGALVGAAFAGVVIGVTLVAGYLAYRAADQLASDINTKRSENGEGK
jgi:hypothetical protein